MKRKPELSIILSAYNAQDYIEESISSILNQTFSDFEFIIINDGSTDNTSKIINSFNDERLIILNQDNIGLTKSLNKGLSLARGKYIARIDADDLCLPNRLQEQIDYINQDDNIGLIGSFYCMWNERKNTIEYVSPPTSNNKLRLFLALRGTPFRHSSVMFRKSVLNTVGGYNENYYNAQDYEFWIRIASQYKVGMVSKYLSISRRNVEGSMVSKRGVLKTVQITTGLKIKAFKKLHIKNRYIILSILYTLASLVPKSIVNSSYFSKIKGRFNRLSLKLDDDKENRNDVIYYLLKN